MTLGYVLCSNGITDRGGPWSLEVESECRLLLQNHCCQLSRSGAVDAVTAVTVPDTTVVNNFFLNIVRGFVG